MRDLPEKTAHIGLVPDFVMDSTEKSGIDFYSSALIRALSQTDRSRRFTIFLTRERWEEFPDLGPHFHRVPIPRIFASGLLNIFWYLFILPFQAYWHRVDLLHLFAGNRRMTWCLGRKMLVTVHDVFHYEHQEIYSFPRYLFFRTIIAPLLKRQRHLVADSHATKHDIQRLLGVPGKAIEVIHLGFDAPRLLAPTTGKLEEPVREKYQLKRPYMLYVSALDHPRKNHLALLEAYEILLQSHPDAPDLVFVGPDFFHAEKIHQAIQRPSLDRRVHALGYVPDQCLPSLYREAKLFVHPSPLEGFGYPLVEAMAFGLPVACADTEIFREIGGAAPVFFDPKQPKDIASKIAMLLADPVLQQEHRKKGLEQAKCYQNDQGIRELLRLYDVLTQRPSIQRDDAQEVEVDSCHHQPLERMERSGSQV
ncbi:MAG: glycosyltransferase family 4 protein [Pirellulaceae bacterium]